MSDVTVEDHMQSKQNVTNETQTKNVYVDGEQENTDVDDNSNEGLYRD